MVIIICTVFLQLQMEQEQQFPDKITIKIKTLNNAIYDITTKCSAKVASIQGKIQQNTGVPVCSQRLLFKGCLLQPVKSLSDYKIVQGSTIKLVANRIPSQASSPSTYRQSQVIKTSKLTQQHLKLKKHKYLQQRTNGFNIKQLQSLEAITQNKNTIFQLLRCLNHNAVEENNLEAFELYKKREFKVGDWVDIRDVSGLWVEGQIIGKYSHFVEVNYNGYPEKWNQWISTSSERIMPFRTQTVQNDSTPYLSPFPMVRPQIPNHAQTTSIESILSTLPEAFRQMTKLVTEIQSQLEKDESNHNGVCEYEDCGQSFKNNRSHNSPRESMHQQQYDIDEKLQSAMIQKKETERNSGSTKGGNKKKVIYGRYPHKNGILSYTKTKSEREHHISESTEIQRNKQALKPDPLCLEQIHTPNTTHHKKIFFSSEKVEEDHSEYLPDQQEQEKPPFIQQLSEEDELKHRMEVRIPSLNEKYSRARGSIEEEGEYENEGDSTENLNGAYHRAISCQSNSSKNASIKPIPEENNEHIYDQNYHNETSLILTPTHNIADNISNKCNEENISNKGEQDNDDISAKSFKSKRSEGLVDTASMKSLIIGSHHDNHNSNQEKAHRKNILLLDHSEAHSVRQTKKNEQNKHSTYYYNQEDILEEEDSQLNEQNVEEFHAQKKRQLQKKLRATQLAPLLDRLGRMMVDMAPHVASMGLTQQYISNQINENLSTYTNQGSLHSRMKNFAQNTNINFHEGAQEGEESIRETHQYWNFQIPVMLTPWEILQLNRLLERESRNPNQ